LNLVLLVLGAIYATFIYSTAFSIAGILVWAAILFVIKSEKLFSSGLEIKIANSVLALYFGAFILLYPLLMPNMGKQLAQALKEQHISKTDEVYVYGNIRAASNIRIQSNNSFRVISMSKDFTLPENQQHFLVFDQKQQNLLDLKNYTLLPGSKELTRIPVSAFPEFMQPAVSKLKESGTIYLIARPINRDNEKL